MLYDKCIYILCSKLLKTSKTTKQSSIRVERIKSCEAECVCVFFTIWSCAPGTHQGTPDSGHASNQDTWYFSVASFRPALSYYFSLRSLLSLFLSGHLTRLTICQMRNRRFSKEIRAINFRFRKEDPQKVKKQRVLAFESR